MASGWLVNEQEIEQLWSLLPHPEGTVTYYMARRRENGLERVVGDYAASLGQLIAAAKAWQLEGFNFYVQPNPALPAGRSRCSAKEVTHWSWFYIDIDPAKDEDPSLAFTAYVDEVGNSLGGWDPLWIDSGRGMQAWFRLPDLWLDKNIHLTHFMRDPQAEHTEQTVEMRMVARRTMGWWLRQWQNKIGTVGGCTLDTSVSDLPRVMRCPGTVNTKTGRYARILGDGKMHDNGLVWRMVAALPHTEFIQPVLVGGMVEGRTWQDVLPLVSYTAGQALRHGATEPGRHKALVATARSLREQGLTPEATMNGLLRVAEKSDPVFEDGEWLERMVRDTYRSDL